MVVHIAKKKKNNLPKLKMLFDFKEERVFLIKKKRKKNFFCFDIINIFCSMQKSKTKSIRKKPGSEQMKHF